MAIITRTTPWRSTRPVDLFSLMERDFNRLFEEVFAAPAPGGESEYSAYAPPVDVVESESDIKVFADLPGLAEKDVQINVTPSVLRLSGEKPDDMKEEKPSHYHMERRHGRFVREVALPEEVDINKVAARMHNGVLEIILRKVSPSPAASRRIDINRD